MVPVDRVIPRTWVGVDNPPTVWGRTLPPIHIAGLVLAGVLANAWALTWTMIEEWVVGPAQGTAAAGADWLVLGRVGDLWAAGANPYAEELFRWNPLMAPVVWALTGAVPFALWTALHVVALFLLPRRVAVIALLTWPFWFDLSVGNMLVFVFVTAWWAYHGNKVGGVVFMALAVLMPRPLMLPLLVWMLWRQPWSRLPFLVIAGVIGTLTLLTGYADDFAERLLASGSEADYVLNLAPSRWIGPLWFPVALGLGAWLTWKGRIGWAAVAIQPYLIPNYLLMALLELRPSADRVGPDAVGVAGRGGGVAAPVADPLPTTTVVSVGAGGVIGKVPRSTALDRLNRDPVVTRRQPLAHRYGNPALYGCRAVVEMVPLCVVSANGNNRCRAAATVGEHRRPKRIHLIVTAHIGLDRR